ncbi:hypothetical protein NDU88_004563 [Pleurodeles waltl]|uniref:Uncharacterized protein n=1 Tax=Pleurodeles waltl TaxID=8319 RepID=A0AAV7T9Q6_PLEWA|nr:hypothetical protein NDU88_004563 [Pleurodeles waltl]
MAPKPIRNLGDKSGGAKMTRIGKDKGEAAGANKRLTSTTGKASGNVSGSSRDAKTGDSNTPPLEARPIEESDLSSGDRSFSESEGSETSEADKKSPSNELTVRQYRQRKMVRTRPGSQEGVENAASMSSRTLKWDYSGIGLIDVPTSGFQGPDNEKAEIGVSAGIPVNASAVCTEAGILQSIYNSIKELQTETRIESWRARIATKRLQGTVRKVAKSCTEIEAKLCSMEERIVAVEEDVDTLKEQNAERDGQLTDVMWKMEDLENRQRRNNLRFLGILKGLEGNNIQAYMVNLLRGAFPELGNWDWHNELQRLNKSGSECGMAASDDITKNIWLAVAYRGNHMKRNIDTKLNGEE